jgi:hypothetical protein
MKVESISCFRVPNPTVIDCSLQTCQERQTWQLVALFKDKCMIRRSSCDAHLLSNFQLLHDGIEDCRYTLAIKE